MMYILSILQQLPDSNMPYENKRKSAACKEKGYEMKKLAPSNPERFLVGDNLVVTGWLRMTDSTAIVGLFSRHRSFRRQLKNDN